MKTCPVCQRTFEETLTFCLVDGSVLSAPHDTEQTLSVDKLPASNAPNPTAVMYPTTKLGPAPVPTMVAPEPPSLYPQKSSAPLREKQAGKSWLLIGIAVPVVLILLVGVIVGLVWLGSGKSNDNSKLPNANATPKPSATVAKRVDGWGSRNDKASLNGERLTYYPVTTPEQCQADCDKDKACRGYTFIRAGTYNPNDSAMCYQMTVVKEFVTNACCISAAKRDTDSSLRPGENEANKCFDDPGASSTDRDVHYNYAKEQTVGALDAGLKDKIGILFNCASMSEEALANAFANISVIIARDVSDANCFGGDSGAVVTDRESHKSWGLSNGVKAMRENLQWKTASGFKCLDREKQSSLFADVSVSLATAPPR